MFIVLTYLWNDKRFGQVRLVLVRALDQIFLPVGSFQTETVSGFGFHPKIDVPKPVKQKIYFLLVRFCGR